MHPEFFFDRGWPWGNTQCIFDFKNYVFNNHVKFTKPTSSHITRSIKTNWTRISLTHPRVLLLFSIFQCTGHQTNFCDWFRLKLKSRKTFAIIVPKTLFFFPISPWEGWRVLQTCSNTPTPLVTPMCFTDPLNQKCLVRIKGSISSTVSLSFPSSFPKFMLVVQPLLSTCQVKTRFSWRCLQTSTDLL